MESIRPKIQFIVDLYFRICDFSKFCCDAYHYSQIACINIQKEQIELRIRKKLFYSSLYGC